MNLSADAISYRIKKLEEKGLLLRNFIVIDGNKFNKIWGIGLFLFKPNKISDIKDKIKSNSSVTFYVESLGVWNVTITFFTSSLNSLYE